MLRLDPDICANRQHNGRADFDRIMIGSSSRHKNAAAHWPGGILAPAGAIRLIRAMPKWIPGKRIGRAIESKYVMPITFKLDE